MTEADKSPIVAKFEKDNLLWQPVESTDEYAQRVGQENAYLFDSAKDATTNELQDVLQQLDRIRKSLADLPARYRHCSFTNFETDGDKKRTDVLQRVRSVAENWGEVQSNLLLFGTVGTGKDHLVFAGIRHLVQFHKMWFDGMQRGRVMTSAQLARWTPSGFKRDGYVIQYFNGPEFSRLSRDFDNLGQFVESCSTSPLLVISDPIPSNTAYQESVLFEVMDARYHNMLPTWWTCNALNREELNAAYSTKLIDRIVDGAVAAFCDWPSYRKKAS